VVRHLLPRCSKESGPDESEDCKTGQMLNSVMIMETADNRYLRLLDQTSPTPDLQLVFHEQVQPPCPKPLPICI
jgi:hypothetical protein